MPTTIIRERNNDTERYMRALKMIKEGYRELEELTEKMTEQFGERRGTYRDRDGDGRYNERGDGYSQRGGYGERYGERYDERYDERDHFEERRGRDSMGRYR